MDTKRSQSLRKVAATPQASKTRMAPKTPSQASVTPSLTESQRLANGVGGEKNPLDALSRNTARQMSFERRSGLQDIDEDYLKRVTMPAMAASYPDYAAGKRTPQQGSLQGTNLARNTAGAEANQAQMGQQQMQQQQQQQMNMTQEQMMAQAQAGQQPAPQMAQVAVSNMQAEMQQQQQQQQAATPAQQVTYMPAAGEPELCTTCPHCQTTIYLTRAPENVPIQAVNAMHGQPEGAGLAAGKQ